MPLQILSSPPSEPEEVRGRIEAAIAEALPGARIAVRAGSPGHFEIDVTSEAFAGKSRVQQQQLVYAAIAPLMSGDAAAVHAVDRMVTHTP
jgi:acid stress-induced BolA-like protein IbaG/YrbA